MVARLESGDPFARAVLGRARLVVVDEARQRVDGGALGTRFARIALAASPRVLGGRIGRGGGGDRASAREPSAEPIGVQRRELPVRLNHRRDLLAPIGRLAARRGLDRRGAHVYVGGLFDRASHRGAAARPRLRHHRRPRAGRRGTGGRARLGTGGLFAAAAHAEQLRLRAGGLRDEVAVDGPLEPSHLAHGVAPDEARDRLDVVLLVAVGVEPVEEPIPHLVRALEPILGALREEAVHEPDQLAIELGAEGGDVFRGRARHQLKHLELAPARPRVPSREELEEHDPEREQIGARVDRLLRRLLGGHVVRVAFEQPGEGLGHPLLRLREAEVGDEHAAVEPDEDVAGRQIAMHELEQLSVRGSKPVGGGETGADLRAEVDDHPLGERLSSLEDRLHEAREGDTLHQLDGEERPFSVGAPPHDVGHVRVIEGGRHPHLVDEHAVELRVLRDVRVEPLHRHELARLLARRADAAELHTRSRSRRDLREQLEDERRCFRETALRRPFHRRGGVYRIGAAVWACSLQPLPPCSAPPPDRRIDSPRIRRTSCALA